jgi:hypothetical protein
MSGELEAAGALATAGAVAGAIEGREGGEPREGECPNCGATVAGRFCSQCGQHAHAHRRLTHVIGEFLNGLLHLDTKTWRTLPMVVFRPGTLTRDYVYGKRARYLSPLTMFLFSIFLLFFAFSFVDAPVQVDGAPAEQRAAAVENLAAAREALAEAERELAAARANPDPDGPPGLAANLAQQAVALARAEVSRREQAIQRIDAVIAARERAGATEGGAPERAAPTESAPAADAEEEPAVDAATAPAPEELEFEGVGFTDGETWQDGVRRLAQREDFVIVQGMPELNERARRRLMNPDLALYQIQEAASKFSFLLAPLSLPFIALLFLWKRGLTFYDHVVYALYALSFAALLFVAVIVCAQIAWLRWLPGWLIVLGLPAHMYFQLKGAYALGWWSALWRTFFMLNFALIVAVLFLTIVVVAGLAG